MQDVFAAVLATTGRRTGREHRVMLRAVGYNGKIYLSRHRPDGDWFLNALANPEVRIQHGQQTFLGNARRVTDEELAKKISELKYHGEERAKEKRAVIEITLANN